MGVSNYESLTTKCSGRRPARFPAATLKFKPNPHLKQSCFRVPPRVIQSSPHTKGVSNNTKSVTCCAAHFAPKASRSSYPWQHQSWSITTAGVGGVLYQPHPPIHLHLPGGTLTLNKGGTSVCELTPHLAQVSYVSLVQQDIENLTGIDSPRTTEGQERVLSRYGHSQNSVASSPSPSPQAFKVW